jgi:hypothetical protein
LWRRSALKQRERDDRIKSLPHRYHEAVSARDLDILNKSATEIVLLVKEGELEPQDVLLAYSKRALFAHQRTNCLTEIMIPYAEQWAKNCNKSGPLAGMPISMKDTVGVEGYDSAIGYSSKVCLMTQTPRNIDMHMYRLVRRSNPLLRIRRSSGSSLTQAAYRL